MPAWTFLRRKDSHRTALAFLDRLGVLSSADRLVVHRDVDATSFRVMRDRRLREALVFDRDFAAAGFIEVRPGR